MKKENLRHYVRVQFSRLTEILFLDLQPIHAPLIDLSLSGMFIEEACEFDASGSCTITFAHRSPKKNSSMLITGKIVRKNRSGIAIQFTEMNYGTYVFLQTLLLYKSENPATVGEEFLKECPFTILDTNNSVQHCNLIQKFPHFQNIRVVNHTNYKNQTLPAKKNSQLSTVTF